MKITANPAKPAFQPIQFIFNVTTQAELDALTCLTNSGRVRFALIRTFGENVEWDYEVFENAGGSIEKTGEFNELLRN